MPVPYKDHRGVPMSPAVLPTGSYQPLNFTLRQVLAGAEVRVGEPPGRDCSFYGGWRDQPKTWFGHGFHPAPKRDCS